MTTQGTRGSKVASPCKMITNRQASYLSALQRELGVPYTGRGMTQAEAGEAIKAAHMKLGKGNHDRTSDAQTRQIISLREQLGRPTHPVTEKRDKAAMTIRKLRQVCRERGIEPWLTDEPGLAKDAGVPADVGSPEWWQR